MVANTPFQASPSRPTSSSPRGGASAAWSPEDDCSATCTSTRTRRAASWTRYRVTRHTKATKRRKPNWRRPEPVGVEARDRIDVLLDVVHLRHVSLDGGVEGRERFRIVAGREPIEHGHDLRAPEALSPLAGSGPRPARCAIAGQVFGSPDGVEPAVDLPAHVTDLAERAGPPIARVPGQALGEGQELVGVAAVVSQDVRLGPRRVDLSQHPEVGDDEEDRGAEDGHAQRPEPRPERLAPRYLSRHIACFLQIRVFMRSGTHAARPVRGRWSIADR